MSFRSKLARFAVAHGAEAQGEAQGARGEAHGAGAGRMAQAQGADAQGASVGRTALIDDLRARMQAVLARSVKPAPPPAVDTPELPFVTTQTPLGPLHVRSVRLSAAHRTGRAPLLPARGASAEVLALLALDSSLASCDPSRALYLDTETTGLAGGAGTVAFLVGLAFWQSADEGAGLVVEQILVRALGEEAPMLEHVAARIRDASMLVTFNGKSFDMPLLRTRYVMARMPAPVEPPHLDLLHVARRVHTPRGKGCKLTAIEKDVLGFERHDDVPSGEVSACYLHFLRTGETRSLLGVVEHNAWDVVTMAALVGLYGEPIAPGGGEDAWAGSQLVPDDLVGVARTLKRAGALAHAMDVADAAVSRGAGAESLRARGEIAKSRGDRQRALLDFETLLEKSAGDTRARLELAKLYEHFVKEPARALAMIEGGVAEAEKAELTLKRAARLTKKLERHAQLALRTKHR